MNILRKGLRLQKERLEIIWVKLLLQQLFRAYEKCDRGHDHIVSYTHSVEELEAAAIIDGTVAVEIVRVEIVAVCKKRQLYGQHRLDLEHDESDGNVTALHAQKFVSYFQY